MDDTFATLKTDETELILRSPLGKRPSILYWGPALQNTDPDELKLLSLRQWAHGGATVDISPSLSNELSAGTPTAPGFIVHRNGLDWQGLFKVTNVERHTPQSISINCDDENTQMRTTYNLSLDPLSNVLTASTSMTNLGKEHATVDWCAALCIPLEQQFTELVTFTGRWAMEFQQQEIPAFRGSFVRENKTGRTSHDNFPGLIARSEFTSETAGDAVGFHLGWSGNSRVRVDRNSDGSAIVQMGELFFPGEMQLAPGDSYTTPPLYAAQSTRGLNTLSQKFHSHLNAAILDQKFRKKARPVHFNSWEASYFDHSEERMIELAEKAASVGAERFVLDDGWFGSRRNDWTGLGDWQVSTEVYPRGLKPLADKLRDLGMEFGIWFEPEMVNPDSDLYRNHPDWVLEAPGVEQIPARSQYALDLSRPEVSDYLFENISAIVSSNDIAYIKWDMNRDIHHPGSAGYGAIHRQTKALYALVKRLRKVHPNLEIESCSSGGGRIDYGILQHTDRVWLSDSNDALDRQSIQRGASYFFPLNVLGSHVGPKVCHTTRRTLSMEFRAATAFFGHMGLELNLLEESQEDLAILKEAITLHKKHRKLLHHGKFVRLEGAAYLNLIGVVSDDKKEALFSCAKLASHETTLPGRMRLAGLNAQKRYRARIIWPQKPFSPTVPSIVEAADLVGKGSVFSGESLLRHGIQLPLMYPETCLIYHFEAV